MESLTLAKALQRKNRLAGRIKDMKDDIQQNNSWIKGDQPNANKPEISSQTFLSRRKALVDYLVALRTALSKATEPIRADLFRRKEMEFEIGVLRGINTSHGQQVPSYRFGVDKRVEYKADIKKSQLDKMVRAIENEMDVMQGRIDAHNAVTTISVEVPQVFYE